MITVPYFTLLINAYCGAAATGKLTYRPDFSPLWSRSRHLTEEQIRGADRVRKAAARERKKPFDPEADVHDALVAHRLLEQMKHRFDLKDAEDLSADAMLAVRDRFLVDKQVTDEEFYQWHGACNLLLGLEVGAVGSDNARAVQVRSVLSKVRDDLGSPSQTSIVLERRRFAAISKDDVMLMCLQGLPEGTTLHRLSHKQGVAAERIGRVAALTGLTWQMAYLNALLCHDGPGSLQHSPAPAPAEPCAGPWSGGAAWIDALAVFEGRFHGEPGRSRGPKSKVNPVASMLAKAKDADRSDEAMRRKLKDLQTGRRALAYSDVQKIWSLTEKATRSELGARRDWETAHFRLLVQGHIAGFLGYIERSVAQSAIHLGKPEMIDDLHGIWGEWPLLEKHAISCLAAIYADHGLQDVIRKG